MINRRRWLGVYETAAGFTMTLRRAGAGLSAQPTNMPAAVLVAQSETRFWDPRGPVLEIQLDGEGTVTGLIVVQGGQRIPATRVR